MNDILVIVLLCLGFLLLAIEVLLVPGFTIFGILGIIVLSVGVLLAFHQFSFLLALLVLLLALGISTTFTLWFFKKGIHGGFSLKERESRAHGFRPFQKDYEKYLGQEGVVHTPLRPAGTVMINTVKLDAVSQAEYIEAGVNVRVIKVEGSKLIVEIA